MNITHYMYYRLLFFFEEKNMLNMSIVELRRRIYVLRCAFTTAYLLLYPNIRNANFPSPFFIIIIKWVFFCSKYSVFLRIWSFMRMLYYVVVKVHPVMTPCTKWINYATHTHTCRVRLLSNHLSFFWGCKKRFLCLSVFYIV